MSRWSALAGLAGIVLFELGALAFFHGRGGLVRESGTAPYWKVPADIRALVAACDEFAIRHEGRRPEGLADSVRPDETGRTLLRQTQLPRDPWGREYLYEPPSAQHAEPRIWTCGRDGRPGGEGDDADLGSWMLAR